eukprot:2719131-Rhodomonas_salina.1
MDKVDASGLEKVEGAATMEEGCLFCGEGFKTGAAEMLCEHGQSRLHPACWKSRSSGVRAVILKAEGGEVDSEGKVSFSKKASKECLKNTHPVYAADGVTAIMWVKETGFQCAQCPARAFTTPMRPVLASGSLLDGALGGKEGSNTEGDSNLEAEDQEVS